MPGILQLPPVADTDYKLRRDNRESLRLATQHYCLVERQGWLLHPQINSALSNIQNPQIVDVATGTGIWAVDTARKYPSAEVVGLDISDKQYPPTWTWPENLNFGLLDLLDEVPSHLQGKFDVVHCRLILSAGPSVDKSIFIDRFSKLLKPGGWLQWDELSWPTQYAVIPPSPSFKTFQMGHAEEYPILQVMKDYLHLDLRNGWFEQFETVLSKDMVFSETHLLPVPIRPHLLKTETDMTVQVLSDLVDVLIKMADIKDEVTLSALRSAVSRLHGDRDAGLMFPYRWNVGIGRKSVL